MRFFRRVRAEAAGRPLRVGVLAGSFNPPTVAHFHLLEAASGHVDELVCIVPRVLPHKIYHGATLEQRVEMLSAPGLRPEYSVAVSDGGLIAEIAEECRVEYGEVARLLFLCGRDAAERIVDWDYGEAGAIERLMERFELLVARRGGEYEPPRRLSHRIQSLTVSADFEDVSSSQIRERIARGDPWRHLAPEALHGLTEKIYG